MSLAAFPMLFPSSVPSIMPNSCSKPGAAVGIADTVANVCLILQWLYKWRTESYTPHISKRKGTQQELGKQTVVGDSAFTRMLGMGLRNRQRKGKLPQQPEWSLLDFYLGALLFLFQDISLLSGFPCSVPMTSKSL